MSTVNVTKLVNLSIQILRVNRKIRDSVTAIVAQENLSLENWLILSVLNDKGGLSMSELSNELGMRISGVSKNVDRLAKRALVFRQQDTYDNRRVLLFISEFGTNKMSRLENKIERLSIKFQNEVNMQNVALSLDMLESVDFNDDLQQHSTKSKSGGEPSNLM